MVEIQPSTIQNSNKISYEVSLHGSFGNSAKAQSNAWRQKIYFGGVMCT